MTNPLYRDLIAERYEHPTWWVTTRPEEVDSTFMQGVRRRALSEAIGVTHDNEEEVA